MPGMPCVLQTLLACPRCAGPLTVGPAACHCAGCGVDFPVRDGIPRLADGAIDRDPRLKAEWHAQHHAHDLYLDSRSVMNHWEEQILPRLVDRLGPIRGPVLDLGCGVGHLGRVTAGKGIELWGLDLQGELLAEAKTGYAALVEGDIHRLPFRSGAFLAVVAANALHHVSDPSRALAEITRVLAPGGSVLLYDPRQVPLLESAKKFLRRGDAAFTAEHKAFRPADYDRLLTGAGLVVEELACVDPVAPLVSTALDLMHAGRLGLAGPAARAAAALDGLIGRLDRTRRIGLMVVAVGRK